MTLRIFISVLLAFVFLTPELEAQSSFKKAVFRHMTNKMVRKLKNGDKLSVFVQDSLGGVRMYKGQLADMTTRDITLKTGKSTDRLSLERVSSIAVYRLVFGRWRAFYD